MLNLTSISSLSFYLSYSIFITFRCIYPVGYFFSLKLSPHLINSLTVFLSQVAAITLLVIFYQHFFLRQTETLISNYYSFLKYFICFKKTLYPIIKKKDCSKYPLFVTFGKQTELNPQKSGFFLFKISNADKHIKILKLACLRGNL